MEHPLLGTTTKGEVRSWQTKRIEAVKALGGCLESITTALLMARKRANIRVFEMDPESRNQIKVLTEIGDHLVSKFTTLGHDEIIAYCKSLSTKLRKLWQEKEIHSKANITILEELTLKFLQDTNPIDQKTGKVMDGYTYINNMQIPNYGLLVCGYIGRSLPLPSTDFVNNAMMETYESFMARKDILSPEKIKDIKEWAKNYFEKMEIRGYSIPKSSASWEKQKSLGGYGTIVSYYYNLIKDMEVEEIPEHLVNLRIWKSSNKELLALEPGKIQERIEQTGSFTYSLALDILNPYIEHMETCKLWECTSKKHHLPMMPIGIKEPGGKARVPCYTTGLLNSILEPIRRGMFSCLDKDRRSQFRLRGGEKEKYIRAFLQKMEDQDILHSSDLSKSTDGIPFEFGLAIAEALIETGKITAEQGRALKLGLGPYRMVKPTNNQMLDRVHLRLAKPQDIRDKLTIPVKSGIPIPKMVKAPDMNEATITQKIRGIKARTGGKTISQTISDFKQKYPEAKTLELIRDQNEYFPQSEFRLGTPEEWEIQNGIPPMNATILDELITDHYRILKYEFEEEHLTRVGVQMGTSISIAILYCLNLYCDDNARKVGKGESLICGDDAIRAGNIPYIEKYREEIQALGGEFSKTKDVVGATSRGVFTEYYIQDGQLLSIPKVKLIVRPQAESNMNMAPEWVRAIGAFNSLRTDIYTQTSLRAELLERYGDIYDALWNYLPLGLPRRSGGLGLIRPLGELSSRIWEKIRSVKDPIMAVEFYRRFTSCITVQTYETQTRPKLDFRHMFHKLPYENWTLNRGDSQYHEGKARWLYLEIRKLRGAIEAAILTTSPHEQIMFKSHSNLEQTIIEQMRENWSILREMEGLEFLTTIPSEEDFMERIYKADIPTSWVDGLIGKGGPST
jgi:hypothetical protein